MSSWPTLIMATINPYCPLAGRPTWVWAPHQPFDSSPAWGLFPGQGPGRGCLCFNDHWIPGSCKKCTLRPVPSRATGQTQTPVSQPGCALGLHPPARRGGGSVPGVTPGGLAHRLGTGHLHHHHFHCSKSLIRQGVVSLILSLCSWFAKPRLARRGSSGTRWVDAGWISSAPRCRRGSRGSAGLLRVQLGCGVDSDGLRLLPSGSLPSCCLLGVRFWGQNAGGAVVSVRSWSPVLSTPSPI